MIGFTIWIFFDSKFHVINLSGFKSAKHMELK